MKLEFDQKAPEFCLENAKQESKCLSDFKGKWLVFYFYPKDNTPGCTTEAIEFTASLEVFKKEGAEVAGVSADTCQSHQKFIDKHDLKIQLLSDTEKKTLTDYGVWQLKKMCGRESMGIVRSTFLIDPEGVVRFIWKDVKVKGHVDEVLKKLVELKG
ncbi:MAG TPA: peroxiredoxin [Spirochaetia bacterium]|nr:peroxiredoxin [Spirochaetia bacterium]